MTTISGMEPLSILASLASLGESATGFIRKDPSAIRALHRCVQEAVKCSLVQQDESFTELATAIFTTISPETSHRLFFEDVSNFGSPEALRIWAERFQDHARRTGIVDPEVNLQGISVEFANRLWREISEELKSPSPLFEPVVWDRLQTLTSSAEPSKQQDGVPQGDVDLALKEGLNNLAELPLPLGIVEHPQAGVVLQRMETRPVVVLAGEPGIGKSVLAQSIMRSESRTLLWWFNASSTESLIASCEALMVAVGVIPGNDPISEVRDLLGTEDNWLVVLDDAKGRDTIDRVIPGNARAGSVIVTTRDSSIFPAESVTTLGPVDQEATVRMAKAHVDSEDSEEDLARLHQKVGGHPLGIVSLSSFKTATGSTWDRVFALLDEMPEYPLSHSRGTGYPASFYDIITLALNGAQNLHVTVDPVMAVLAACGGEVPRLLLEAVLIADPREIDQAIQALRSSGVIHTTPGLLSCHALTTQVASSSYSTEQQTEVIERLFITVEALCSNPLQSSLLPQLSSVIERLEGHVSSNASLRLRAHIALAEELSGRGWIASAERHLDLVLAGLSNVEGTAEHAALLSRCSRVLLDSAAYSKLRLLLRNVLSGSHKIEPRVRAGLLVIDAWAAESLNDSHGAQVSAGSAVALLPDDNVMAAMQMYFGRASNNPTDRIEKYMSIVHDESHQSTLRASFASLAARDLRELGRGTQAVETAHLALKLDEEAEGPDSVLVARDCTDLGSALIEEKRYDDAEKYLERALAIYRAEKEDHPHASVPLLHLGRMRTVQAQRSQSTSQQSALFAEAANLLAEAERLTRLGSDRSIDLAAILYERAQTLSPDASETLDLLEEAAAIDREYFGEDHPEVGKDLALALFFAVQQKKSHRAARYLGSVRQYLKSWESSIPNAVLLVLLAWRQGVESGVLLSPTRNETAAIHRQEARLRVALGFGLG